MSRFAVITAQDHGAYLWLATLLSLSFSSFTWVLRAFARYGLYGIDDLAVTAAHVVAFGEWAAVIIALNNGFGKTEGLLSQVQEGNIGKDIMTSQIFFILVLALSKSSIMLLIRRIFTQTSEIKFAKSMTSIMLTVVMIWGVAAVLTISMGCPTTHVIPGRFYAACSGDILRWRIVVALDVCIEGVFALMPVYFIYNVQMKGSTKALAVSAFAFRLPLIAFSMLYLQSYTRSISNQNAGFSFSVPIIWQQATLCYSLLSATFPFIQAFVRNFTTGGMGFSTTAYGSYINNAGSGGTYRLDSVKPDRKGAASISYASRDRIRNLRLRADTQGHTTTVSHANEGHAAADGGSVRSGGSQELIIRREDGYSVRYD